MNEQQEAATACLCDTSSPSAMPCPLTACMVSAIYDYPSVNIIFIKVSSNSCRVGAHSQRHVSPCMMHG